MFAVLTIGFLLAAAPAGLATASSSPRADLDDFDIRSFDAEYVLSRDDDGRARLQVVETIVAEFPDFDQNKGFYRDIPEYRHGVQLQTRVESVVDENGDPVPYTTEYYQDFFSVGLGDDSYVRGEQTYVITYSQVDVVATFADTGVDEFYWDVNGTGWAQPFGSVSMVLLVDAAIAPALTGAQECYVFDACDTPITATPLPDGAVEIMAGATDLVPNESLTVAVAFEAGTFEPGEIVVPPTDDPSGGPASPQPTWWDQFAPFILGPAGLIVSWIAGGTQASDRSRRTGASDIIVPQYTPPKDLNVMVAAYLSGRPERAFAAQLVALAVRKKVRLLDDPTNATAPFEVELLDVTELDELETQLVTALFGAAEPGRRVPVGPTVSLGTRLTSVYRAVDKKLKSDGLQGAAKPTVLWVVLCLLSVAIVAVAAFDTLRRFNDGFIAEIGLVATFVAFFGATATFGRRSTVATLSSTGRERNDYLLGMRDYMQLAEADRIKVLQSPEGAERVNVDDSTQMVKLYERLLPYAIIFGIERQWTEELTVRAAEAAVPVTWWAGSSDFSAWRLHSTISNIRNSTPEPPRPLVAKAKTSSSGSGWGGWGTGSSSGGWRGSSGSSFSGGSRGGGFSGGGGGGGGGRGR